MFKTALTLLCLLFLLPNLNAQVSTDFQVRELENSFYVTWGYNRSYYRPSTIEFKGEQFDFTLQDVTAHDDPEEFQAKVYLNPLKFTIPQFNFRLGYYIKENLSLSVGWDHMKYVITLPQRVTIDGYIDPQISSTYGGTYVNQTIDLQTNFVQYEHTDGLNYVRVGLEKYAPFYSTNNNVIRVDMSMSASAGFMLPWTDFQFFNTRYRNRPHLSGWAVSGTMAPRIHFKNIFFLQWQVQYGYIRMGDILLQDDASSRAKQEIFFNETSISLGANLPIYWRRKAAK